MTPPTGYFRLLIAPETRNHVVTVAAALLVIFVIQVGSTSSLIAGGLPALLGVAAVLSGRATVLPALVFLSVGYLQICPFVVPMGGIRVDVAYTHFDVTHMILAAAVGVYLFAQYRLFGIMVSAVPGTTATRSTADRRPLAALDDGEIMRLIVTAVGAVIAGQLLWLVFAEVEFDLGGSASLVVRTVPTDPATLFRPNWSPSRYFWFAVVFGGPVLICSLVFWWLRVKTLTREEALVYLTDQSWREMRREAARQETWRAWPIVRRRKVLRPMAAAEARPKRRRPSCLLRIGTVILILLLVQFIIRMLNRYL